MKFTILLFIFFMMNGCIKSSNTEIADVEKYKIIIPESLVKDSGGFYSGIGSGIDFVKKDKNGNLEFVAISDRGPNFSIKNSDNKIIFLKHDFTPKIVKILVDKNSKIAEVTDFINISYKGKDITGISASKNNTDEEIYDKNLKRIKSNFGLDTESVAVLKTGGYVIGDEYYPSINITDTKGKIINRFIPGNGLPEIFKYRNFNRGFESVAVTPSGKIFAVLEGVINIDDNTRKNAKLIRILEFDINSKITKIYAYSFDYDQYKNSSKVKIGDIAAIDDENFLLVEQGEGIDSKYRNLIYKINTKDAMDISNVMLLNGKELEYGTLEDLKNIKFVKKEFLFNPRDYGWVDDKLEGLTIIDSNSIAISNDNDFAIIGYDVIESKCNEESDKLCQTVVAKTDKSKELTNLWIFNFKSKIN